MCNFLLFLALVLSLLLSESTNITLLRLGFHHIFVDKSTLVIKNVAAESEPLAILQDIFVNVSLKENLQKYLRSSTNIITNNIFTDKNRNDNVSILSVDK